MDDKTGKAAGMAEKAEETGAMSSLWKRKYARA